MCSVSPDLRTGFSQKKENLSSILLPEQGKTMPYFLCRYFANIFDMLQFQAYKPF